MKNNEFRLFKIVEEQQGYFTTKQAVACGYVDQNHRHHVSSGAWIRVYRGIYRLARFPRFPEDQYSLWSLWSRDRDGKPQGVFSHQTALSIHELSDVMPAKLHVTVPPGFRRNTAMPGVLALHRAILPESDVELRQGYRVTRPLRTITDMLLDGSESHDHLRQALQQGLERGLIAQTELRKHPEHAVLQELLERGGA